MIYGIISTIRIHNKCKHNKIKFDPIEGNIIEYTGFITGITTSCVALVILCVKYLP